MPFCPRCRMQGSREFFRMGESSKLAGWRGGFSNDEMEWHMLDFSVVLTSFAIERIVGMGSFNGDIGFQFASGDFKAKYGGWDGA